MRTLFQDLRYAGRMLARSPAFTAATIATLALGIGANSAIFTVVNRVLLRPLPFPRSGELVRVTSDLAGRDLRDAGLSVPELFDYRERSGAFSRICGLFPINANITGLGRPERAEVLLVDVDYFDLLGVKPQLGRLFRPEDREPGIAPVAVVSDGWWRRHGADRGIAGRKIRLDDDIYTVLGVTPPGFRHPGRGIEADPEVWAPSGWLASPFRAPNRRAYFLRGALARLAPGVSPASAQQALDRLAASMRREFGSDYPPTDRWAPRVVPLQTDLVGNVRPALLVLSTAVGLVLLIACANVANLLLARAASRQREIAIRRALGAGRGRLFRQLLTESLLLAVLGGALGLALAIWGTSDLLRLAPAGLVPASGIEVDARVLLFSAAISLGTGLVFGLAPAISVSGSKWEGVLKDVSRGSSGALGGRLRSGLVVAEFALAVVLLVGAALLVRTLERLRSVDPGFDPNGVTTATLWLPQPNLPETGRYFSQAARNELTRKILNRVRGLLGVEKAALATSVPFGTNRFVSPFTIEGRDPAGDGAGAAELSSVSEGYFAAAGIALLRGRPFDERDAEKANPVAIVSDSFARRYFPAEDAIGHRVRLPLRDGPGPWLTIVGVSRDVKTQALDALERPLLYRPMLQASNLSLTLFVRGPAGPAALAPALEREIQSLDPEIPVYGVRPMTETMAATVATRRAVMVLLGLFAALAVTLAAVGISGVMAHRVSQRVREIGIRVALGARPSDVLWLLLSQGLRLTAIGLVLGLAGALALTRGLSALLFHVSPRDPAAFGAIGLLLAAVALAACYLPSRRAARLDPSRALRTE